ncbi:unnamed protein product [Symbiodinium natans]|uniref:Uncharacterized protein n=1 Tax=Symbiodinium natans TaxID=878477 RepID=A0A812RID7_9DINO|nr:unnamed protein product [Symbiodinium natans]
MGENASVLQGWRVGLKRASSCVLDFEMDKSKTIALYSKIVGPARAALGSQSASNSIDLSSGVSKQVEYAAMDVWVALRLSPPSGQRWAKTDVFGFCLLGYLDSKRSCAQCGTVAGGSLMFVTAGSAPGNVPLKGDGHFPELQLWSSGPCWKQLGSAHSPPLDSTCHRNSRSRSTETDRFTTVRLSGLLGYHLCDPIYGTDICYEPVCPPGYFRCCATCYEAPCYGLKKDLQLSWRGIYECILCESGDYCDGCDTFSQCPDNTQANREGPRVSRAGSTRIADCESCAAGMQASFRRDRCVEAYSHVCNEEFVQRCIRSCKAEEPSRGKRLTPCEQIKCEVYCAKQWSNECLGVVGGHCRSLTTIKDSGVIGADGLDAQAAVLDCDVDCNSAFQHGLAWLILALLCLHLS